MVNIRKRGNVYKHCFEAETINGKRKQIIKSGFKTKREALIAGQTAYVMNLKKEWLFLLLFIHKESSYFLQLNLS